MPGLRSIEMPCVGESHARFDEEGEVKICSLLYQFFWELILKIFLLLIYRFDGG